MENNKQKIYFLDTNILIEYPKAIYGFKDNIVAITSVTFEELDNLKIRPGDTGYRAREAIRVLRSSLKEITVNQIVKNDQGAYLLITNQTISPINHTDEYNRIEKPDSKIVAQVMYTMETFLEKEIILITNDISMQLNAEIHGIHTQRYRNSEIKTEDIYLGRAEYGVNDSVINQLYEENMDKQDIIFYDMRTGSECKPDIKENEYLNLQGSSKSILAVYRDGKISKINTDYTKVISQLKNSGQRFAMEALLAPAEKIPLVILKGRAGTAKTFLSVAAGLHQTIQENYNKMIVTRNSVFFDNDIGYLPGSEEEKMSPLLRPVFDNLEEVMRIRGTEDKDLRMTIEDLLDSEIIKVESLAYMRGRSLGHTYLFVDEAQNATPNQIKGIITRAGIGTKIVLCGDPEQIDNPSLSLYNNGLSYASAKFAGSKLCAQITFLDKECVRSDLAMAGAELL